MKNVSYEQLIAKLSAMPKAKIDLPDFAILRTQILNKISIPVKQTESRAWFGVRMTVGVIGSCLILISLAMGTAVAALDSVPGQSIYPLKKIVENIELKLTTDEAERASLQLKFAENRVSELEEVLEQNQEGKLSNEETQKIVARTVKDLQKTTSAAAASPKPKTALVNKLKDLNNKLQSASINSEGEVKLELQKAVEATKISREEAIANMERAGLKVENNATISLDDVSASGKLTIVSETSVSIGTAKFFLSPDTKFVNIQAADLRVDLFVSIKGEIKDNKSFALEITAETVPNTESQ